LYRAADEPQMNAGFSKRSSGISNNGLQQERKHRMRIKLVLGFWLLGITLAWWAVAPSGQAWRPRQVPWAGVLPGGQRANK
jgi:hypothetical protein